MCSCTLYICICIGAHTTYVLCLFLYLQEIESEMKELRKDIRKMERGSRVNTHRGTLVSSVYVCIYLTLSRSASLCLSS